MANLKALSLYQPWASLIMAGRKTIETRSWATKYRGPLAIHASKARINADAAAQFYPLLAKRYYPQKLLKMRFSTGAVLGIVILKGGVQFPKPLAPPAEYGAFTEGRFWWLLMNVEKFETPIPAKGHLGLWNWIQEGEPR